MASFRHILSVLRTITLTDFTFFILYEVCYYWLQDLSLVVMSTTYHLATLLLRLSHASRPHSIHQDFARNMRVTLHHLGGLMAGNGLHGHDGLSITPTA
jgi:hypothetical protein